MGTGISGMLSDAAAVNCQMKKKRSAKKKGYPHLLN